MRPATSARTIVAESIPRPATARSRRARDIVEARDGAARIAPSLVGEEASVTPVEPLHDHDLPEYQGTFARMQASVGYVPNSFRTLGHRPEIPEALRALVAVVFLFTDAERAALRLALAPGQQPNGATAQHFEALRPHDDGQIVELVAVMATFGFFNRRNETMATELEDVPTAVARDHLGGLQWDPGRHRGA